MAEERARRNAAAMADITFAFGSSYSSLADMNLRKRQRTAYDDFKSSEVKASKIEDRRVATSALRLECDLITIKVGEPQRTFRVHADVINQHTEYFRGHVNFNRTLNGGGSVPGETCVVHLSDHDPDAFALWSTWCYTGQLAILPETPFSPDSMDEQSTHYAVLAHAYVLGDYLVDIPFMNAIADVYVLNARGIDGSRALYPSNEEIGVLYDGTNPDSPIRKLLLDIWMYRGKPEWLEKELIEGALPREFLVAAMRELLKLKKSKEGETLSRPWKMTHRQYHDLRDESPRSTRERRADDTELQSCAHDDSIVLQ